MEVLLVSVSPLGDSAFPLGNAPSPSGEAPSPFAGMGSRTCNADPFHGCLKMCDWSPGGMRCLCSSESLTFCRTVFAEFHRTFARVHDESRSLRKRTEACKSPVFEKSERVQNIGVWAAVHDIPFQVRDASQLERCLTLREVCERPRRACRVRARCWTSARGVGRRSEASGQPVPNATECAAVLRCT